MQRDRERWEVSHGDSGEMQEMGEEDEGMILSRSEARRARTSVAALLEAITAWGAGAGAKGTSSPDAEVAVPWRGRRHNKGCSMHGLVACRYVAALSCLLLMYSAQHVAASR